MKDNCFTEFCCFLSNLNMNQPQVYTYPLPVEPPSHLCPIPTLDWHRAPVWVSWDTQQIPSKFPLAIYFTYGIVSVAFLTLTFILNVSCEEVEVLPEEAELPEWSSPLSPEERLATTSSWSSTVTISYFFTHSNHKFKTDCLMNANKLNSAVITQSIYIFLPACRDWLTG